MCDKHVFAYDFYISLYKHLRAHTNFLEIYGKWACIYES